MHKLLRVLFTMFWLFFTGMFVAAEFFDKSEQEVRDEHEINKENFIHSFLKIVNTQDQDDATVAQNFSNFMAAADDTGYPGLLVQVVCAVANKDDIDTDDADQIKEVVDSFVEQCFQGKLARPVKHPRGLVVGSNELQGIEF